MTVRRATLIAGVVAAGAGIATAALETNGRSATGPNPAPATATAAVVRTTLASRQQVAGTLQHAGSYTLVAQRAGGTLTWLPTPGTVIRRADVLYRIDGQPVLLLYGSESAWRTLALGVADGADVRQLKQNLLALGFTAYGALTADEHLDWATAVAIEQWQRAQGIAVTGVMSLGSVAFLPGAMLVSAQRALPGAPAQPGTPVLDLSSTGLVVSVSLDPSLRQLVHVSDRVRIQLPLGQITTGRVSQIGADTAASSTPAGSPPASPDGSGQAGNPAAQGSTGPSTTVPVMISLNRPGDARGLDQVPVTVQLTDTVHRAVMAVPIGALLALAQGGYAVAVEDHGNRTLMPVMPGIFDGARVEVSSSRLRPGMRVEVPSS